MNNFIAISGGINLTNGDGMGGGKKSAGGRASAEQQRFNQLGIDEIKSQFKTTEGNFQPFIQAGQESLGNVQQNATLEGFGQNLSDIFSSGALDALIGKRTTAVEGQLSSGGLTRSGEGLRQIADIPTELGFQLEQLLSGRQSNIASSGLNATTNLGQLSGQASGNIAGILGASGKAGASGILGDQQAQSAGIGQVAAIAATVLPLIFSDPDLKENIEEVGKINDLKVYQWDWIKEAQDTMVGLCHTMGFMADEVQEKYSQYVSEFNGWKVIDYDSLLSHLEVDNNKILEAA